MATTEVFSKKERVRFFKFVVVGLIGAIIDFGIMNLLTQVFQMNLVPAGTISFISAVTSNFVWNRYWTYPESRSRSIAKQMTMFFAVNIAGLVIRLPILYFLEPPMHPFFHNLGWNLPLDPDFLAKNFTLAFAVGVVMLWNFFVNRYWTYNDVDAPLAQSAD